MPELPEVEVTRRGIAGGLVGRAIVKAEIRDHRLRWPVDPALPTLLLGLVVDCVERRGKYLLLGLNAGQERQGWLIIHLGMSGSLRFVPPGSPARKHEHFDLATGQSVLRLTDPRRFGSVLWHPVAAGPVLSHRLLAPLGVEPLSADFDAAVLHRGTRGKNACIKQVLLAGDIVVGVGNIYASESLFRARINPKTAAGRIGLSRYGRLAHEIRAVLSAAIARGGSTLRDFSSSDGPGYFQLDYFAYGRDGLACRLCATPIRRLVQGQRATFYCPRCQR